MKTANNKTRQRLLQYSGAAAAVLSAQPALAQPDTIRTVVDSLLDNNGQFFDFDFDTNGVVDFRITQFVDSTRNDINGSIIAGRGPAANAVLGLDYGDYNYPFKLSVGDTIGPGKPFKGLDVNNRVGYLGLIIGSATYPNSQFTGGVTDGFIGVRFQAEVDSVPRSFYGWIRVDVAADLKSITIRDFAYVNVPDSMIRAGFGSPLDVEQPPLTQEFPASMAQRGSYLHLDLPEGEAHRGRLRFFDLSGRLLARQEISDRQSRHDLSFLPEGISVAHLEYRGQVQSIRVVNY